MCGKSTRCPVITPGLALRAYIDPAGIGLDKKGYLSPHWARAPRQELSETPMGQPDAWRMILEAGGGGLVAAGGQSFVSGDGDHGLSFSNGGALEHAQEMAAHESPRTTKLYDRTKERLTQDEVERIRL